jgi:threonine dehydrogenase-like Zn-dependent dehydrogenase
LLEPLAIGCQAVKRSRLASGETILVMGAGPIGLLTLQVARARGARTFVTDIDADRLALARRLGADAVIDPEKEDIKAWLEGQTDGEGPNVVIEAVGSGPTIRQAVDLVSAAGRVVIVGLYGGVMDLEPLALIRKELDVMGSRNSNGMFPEAIALLRGGKVHLGDLVTHRFELGDAPSVFQGIDQGSIRPVKAVLTSS